MRIWFLFLFPHFLFPPPNTLSLISFNTRFTHITCYTCHTCLLTSLIAFLLTTFLIPNFINTQFVAVIIFCYNAREEKCMKKLFNLVFLILVMIIPFSVNAEDEMTTVEVNSLGIGTYFYAHTFDNLVFDFSIKPTIIDVLESFTLKNNGTARVGSEIEKLVLYRDNGDNIFQGFAIDQYLATADYDYVNNQWVFMNLDYVVGLQGERFFVVAEMASDGLSNRTFQFYLPAYFDLNENQVYEAGDSGLFLLSESFLPQNNLMADTVNWYKEQTGDVSSPLVVPTNLVDGKVFNNITSYIVRGRARDAGPATLEKVEFCVDSVCSAVKNTGVEYDSWEYTWQFNGPGTYQIVFKGTDSAGNISQTEPIEVQVYIETFISYKTSAITFDKANPIGNSVDKVTIDVYLRDQFNSPVADQLVEIQVSSSAVPVDKSYDYTDVNGRVQFLTWSPKAGEVNYTFYINGARYNTIYALEFVTGLPIINYEVGRFVKLPDQSAVYFLDSNNIRHAYPTQKVWESYFGNDFSRVEVISHLEMASYSLGRNVPFKKGTLMKIPSVPKVYEIGNGGVMHWIPTPEIAVELHGSSWYKKVNDLPESFFTDYLEGLIK